MREGQPLAGATQLAHSFATLRRRQSAPEAFAASGQVTGTDRVYAETSALLEALRGP